MKGHHQILLALLWSVWNGAASDSFTQLRGNASVSDKDPDEVIPVSIVSSGRKGRFPSVDDRIKLYMSNWYVPPCPGNTNGFVGYTYDYSKEWPSVSATDLLQENVNQTTLAIQNMIKPDILFLLDSEILHDCARPHKQYAIDQENGTKLKTEARVKFRINMNMYCTDAVDLLRVMEHLEIDGEESDIKDTTPLLLQFGDRKRSHDFGMINLPHIKKFRSGTTAKDLQQVTSAECFNGPRPMLTNNHDLPYFSPIIWKLATHRHFLPLFEAYDLDTPWNEKKDMAIFRGQLTGIIDDDYDKHDTDLTNCIRNRRCRLVYESGSSKHIDANLTNTRKRVDDIIEGVTIKGPKVYFDHLMTYKGIIMIEGNDVASGLKWALLSQSVVLMAQPSFTSWAMEELLEPWVHYVPINREATDIEEMFQWVLDNDEKARKISERASLWMEDLIFHPDAEREDALIKEEMMKRYKSHFVERA